MLTPFFFGTCQSGGQAGDGEWAGAGLKGRKEDIGPLGHMGDTADGPDGAKERVGEATLANYLLDFVSFVLEKVCFLICKL